MPLISLSIHLDSAGQPQMTLYWSKDAKAYRLKNIYEAKQHSFWVDILRKIAERAQSPTIDIRGVSNC